MAGGDPAKQVRAILADPRFVRPVAAPHVAPPAPPVWQQLWGWFVDHILAPLFRPLERISPLHLGDHGEAVAFVVLGIAAVALVFVALRVGIAILAHRRGRAADAAAAGPAASALESTRSSRAWLANARTADARGDRAAAIAAYWWAGRCALDEAGVVGFDAARTPGEYRSAVRAKAPPLAEPFDELAGGFVRSAYGPVPPDGNDVAAARTALARLDPRLGT